MRAKMGFANRPTPRVSSGTIAVNEPTAKHNDLFLMHSRYVVDADASIFVEAFCFLSLRDRCLISR